MSSSLSKLVPVSKCQEVMEVAVRLGADDRWRDFAVLAYLVIVKRKRVAVGAEHGRRLLAMRKLNGIPRQGLRVIWMSLFYSEHLVSGEKGPALGRRESVGVPAPGFNRVKWEGERLLQVVQ